jgi:7-cyano-7-deazaguanine synthase in queuosine biosynthesis
LIAALAAQHVGAKSADPDLLRTSLIRRMCEEPTAAAASTTAAKAPVKAEAPAEPAPARATIATTVATAAAAKPAAASRPDLTGFAKEVKTTARKYAEGWPGNRKAFISQVWSAIATAHPAWGLSEIEFKAMLTEAHRTGHIVLANADLKDKKNIGAVQASAISYKNTVWHFIRVED